MLREVAIIDVHIVSVVLESSSDKKHGAHAIQHTYSHWIFFQFLDVN